MATLTIIVQNSQAGMELVMWPSKRDEYGDEYQYIISETPLDGERTQVEIDLGRDTDTDAQQEQYLNANPYVLQYEVR